MLYVPFILGILVAGSCPWQLVLLWVAITALFIGRDALQNWSDARRRGQPSSEGTRALIYAAISLLAGAPLVLVYRIPGMVPSALLAGLIIWRHHLQTRRRQGRTIAGEFISIAGITISGPVAHHVASGSVETIAALIWFLSLLYFASSVFYVKQRVLATQPRRSDEYREIARASATYHAAVVVIMLAVVLGGVASWWGLLAFAPAVIRATWYLLWPSPVLNLVRVGVLEIVYSLIFLVCAWQGLMR